MSVKITVSPASLLWKDARRVKLWNAIHSLITSTLSEDPEEEIPDEQEEGELQQPEVVSEVSVTFSPDYFKDETGLWTQLLQREGVQSKLEFDRNSGSIVGMNQVESLAFQRTSGFNPASRVSSSRKLCFNCGKPGHEVSACPDPIDKIRIAENKSSSHATVRYFDTEKFAGFKDSVHSGQLSTLLRHALGLKDTDEDPFVAIRLKLGPPPVVDSETAELGIFNEEKDGELSPEESPTNREGCQHATPSNGCLRRLHYSPSVSPSPPPPVLPSSPHHANRNYSDRITRRSPRRRYSREDEDYSRVYSSRRDRSPRRQVPPPPPPMIHHQLPPPPLRRLGEGGGGGTQPYYLPYQMAPPLYYPIPHPRFPPRPSRYDGGH